MANLPSKGLGDSTKPQGGYDKRTVAGDIHELVRALGHEGVVGVC